MKNKIQIAKEALEQAKMDMECMRLSFPTAYDREYFKSCIDKVNKALEQLN